MEILFVDKQIIYLQFSITTFNEICHDNEFYLKKELYFI